jgi:transposase-like protein
MHGDAQDCTLGSHYLRAGARIHGPNAPCSDRCALSGRTFRKDAYNPAPLRTDPERKESGMSMQHPPEDVEKALALAAAGASVATIAKAAQAAESTVRRWLRKASAGSEPRRPGPPSHAQPAISAREPSAEPSALADGPAGAPAPPCGIRCNCDGPPEPLSTSDVCRRLEARLSDLVDQTLDAEQSGRIEDRMLKICRIIEFLRGGDELGATLRAMKDFAAFCIRLLPESEMRIVRMVIARFLDKLKKEHS